MAKAMTKKQQHDMMINNLEQDSGAGFEEADRDSFSIPFLYILQSGSPQCKRSDGAYIEGAQEGMLYDTALEEIYDGDVGLTIVPVHFRRSFVEWIDQDAGGGFVGEHSVEDAQTLLATATQVDGKTLLPNGHTLVDTRTHYVLVVLGDEVTPAVISMSSTQVKKSRKWMTVMQGLKMARPDGSKFTPPMFSQTYKVTTVPESNDKGSWYGWKFEHLGALEDLNQYEAAKQFRNAILQGEAKAVPPSNTTAQEDEVPF